MENTKTISYLNSKTWYRFLKVVFYFFILVSILIFNGLIISNGVKGVDNNKTLIYCSYKSKKIFTPKQANIKLSNYQLKDGFDYREFYEGYNENEISAILHKCYDSDPGADVFVLQRYNELTEGKPYEELSEAEKSYVNSEIEKITTGFKTNSEKAKYLDYSMKFFDIEPVYSYTEFIKLFVIGNLIILLVFEVLRRIFYYIVLGTIRPLK